jgi:hypothetical protein
MRDCLYLLCATSSFRMWRKIFCATYHYTLEHMKFSSWTTTGASTGVAHEIPTAVPAAWAATRVAPKVTAAPEGGTRYKATPLVSPFCCSCSCIHHGPKLCHNSIKWRRCHPHYCNKWNTLPQGVETDGEDLSACAAITINISILIDEGFLKCQFSIKKLDQLNLSNTEEKQGAWKKYWPSYWYWAGNCPNLQCIKSGSRLLH